MAFRGSTREMGLNDSFFELLGRLLDEAMGVIHMSYSKLLVSPFQAPSSPPYNPLYTITPLRSSEPKF